MISYLITSSLLLIPAWLMYRLLVRGRTSSLQQKAFVYLTIGGSLLLPALGTQSVLPLPAPNATIPAQGFGLRIEASHLQQYCRCESPNYAHRVQYQANAWYNLLFKHKLWLNVAIFAAMGFSLLRLVFQLFYLYRLVNQSQKKQIVVAGKAVCLLLTPKKLGIGAFWLGKPYVIWQEELSSLTEVEREAVFRHELSHLHQKNTLEKGVLSLIQCLWFFHPLFYFFRKELALLSEFIADEKAAPLLPSPQAYARLLLRIKEYQHLPMVDGLHQQSLRLRIEHLLSTPSSPRTSVIWLLSMLGLGMLQLALVGPLSAHVNQQVIELQTYEKIYHKVPTRTNQAVYCTDCETICTPEE